MGKNTNINSTVVSAVPTNIITGFLGVGKTTAILHLLKHKPDGERWAVLVNEFGEIGVDGSLYTGQYTEEQGVYIREVPGGCMCCTAGLPMQVALNQLLKKANPDRLLIEPTGLGHPKEVLQSLTTEAYHDVVALQKIVTLVDARKLSDTRYTEHLTFNQQVAIADIVVGNKQDLYQEGDKERLEAYVNQTTPLKTEIVFTQQGDITAINLRGKTSAITSTQHHHHHDSVKSKPLLSETPIPECGYIKAMNSGEGFQSIGWRLSAERIFNYEKLSLFLKAISAERVKAVFLTDKGIFSYNLTADALNKTVVSHCTESHIEIIATDINESWEVKLLECIAPND